LLAPFARALAVLEKIWTCFAGVVVSQHPYTTAHRGGIGHSSWGPAQLPGMGDDGVNRGKQAEVINVRARWNGSSGIYAQQGSTVTGSSAYQNGGFGFYVEADSTVSGNTAYLNFRMGIVANHGSTVSGNTMRVNEGYVLDLGPQVG
jgi:parallel beta-helix repeat protein